eukprot:1632594-Pleurochrysis_carterae.AAC.2
MGTYYPRKLRAPAGYSHAYSKRALSKCVNSRAQDVEVPEIIRRESIRALGLRHRSSRPSVAAVFPDHKLFVDCKPPHCTLSS